MHTRLERAELLRSQALTITAAQTEPAHLLETAAGDAESVQSAWCSFVPYLAHPVMANPAGRAMEALDAAASALTRGRTAAA